MVFSQSIRSSCVNIEVTDDSMLENEEQFSLRLADHNESPVTKNFVLEPNTSTIIIQDNECKK